MNRVRPELSQGDCAGGHRVENRRKNRSVVVLPPDKHRPYITSFQVRIRIEEDTTCCYVSLSQKKRIQRCSDISSNVCMCQGNECTDYINAVFVDGYSRLNQFIVTEWPLANTTQNFWSMLYDHDVVTVVVLDPPPKNSNK